ncbi:MAG: ADP-ribosylglycohydrolase family protein [Pseudomonadales bacterium]
MNVSRECISNAWKGRVSGCQLGKAVERLSMSEGPDALHAYLGSMQALPLRDYVPDDGSPILFRRSCRGQLQRAEPDDDLNYSVLALMLLERHGADLATVDVARAWLRWLPFAAVFTAEKAAYLTLAMRAHDFFAYGADAGFDLADCADNAYNDWIGAQIRADVYGWVCPGDPALAARLAARDAALSHRGAGVHGAVFVAACGAAIPAADSLGDAVRRACAEIPEDSPARWAIDLGRAVAGRDDALALLRAEYAALSPVHTLNNLALVVWALLSYPDDFDAAIGEVVAAGWDTDCNGATVGGLWGITGRDIPARWTDPWQGRVAVSLAGQDEHALEDLVDRTVAVAMTLAAG